ncbi:MAG: hypothetical protein K8L97_08980 [Anaerolineae bacterium]|nr:hypothetical protein [Anaerolineae bacterium]
MRFPIMRTYRTILIGFSAAILVLGFFGAVAGSFLLSSEITYNYTADGAYYPIVIRDTPRQVAFFIGIYLLVVLWSAGFLFLAEIMKLGLNIEDHLYHIRNPNKPLSDIRREKRVEEARKKVEGEVRKVAAEWLERSKKGANIAGTEARKIAEKGLEIAQSSAKKPATDESVAVLSPTNDKPSSNEKSSTLETVRVTLEQQPPPKTGMLMNPAETAYKKGFKLYQEKKYVLAIPYLNQAIQLDPNYANAYGCRASCHKELGETDLFKADMSDYKRLMGKK